MRIDLITVLPQFMESILHHSIIARAIEKKSVSLCVHDLRTYGMGKHRQVDDYLYGGSAGMVLQIEPIVNCIEHLQATRKYNDIIYMAPDGELLTQSISNQLSLSTNLIILCGHYKGVDQRLRDHFITKEISVGPYVLSGGELPAAILVDSIVRLIPGAISDATSALSDSFQDGMIAPPVYTRPANFRGWQVPSILLSGDRAKIKAWEEKQAQAATLQWKKKNN